MRTRVTTLMMVSALLLGCRDEPAPETASAAASCRISRKRASSTLYEQLQVTSVPPGFRMRSARRLMSL